MTNVEILEHLKKLPATERLSIVESTVHQLRQEFQISGPQPTDPTESQLALAAKALLADYATDKELTALTALDGERMHA